MKAVPSYHDAWIEDGRRRCEFLHHGCGDILCDLQHVGSTAVYGLAGRPIIDIVMGLYTMSDFQVVKTRLTRLGYSDSRNSPHPQTHLFHLKSDHGVCTEHLYVLP